MLFDENIYLILAQRYKELAGGESVELVDGEVPYDLVGYLTEIDTGMIDANYMNSRFEKYLKLIGYCDCSSFLAGLRLIFRNKPL